MIDSFWLLSKLKQHYKIDEQHPYWWENAGTFEVVLGAILTQRSTREKLHLSLQNLQNFKSIDKITRLDESVLQKFIEPSGFCKQKAKIIKTLCKNIQDEFYTFENFTENVNRQWLLNQRGIGFESADIILNYACKKEFFVVSSCTLRLLLSLNFCFESYEQIQEWIVSGLDERVYTLYPKDTPLAQIYARMHGKIVIFCKQNLKSKNILKKDIFSDI